MASNPLSYKDLFDFSDDGGIKGALRDVRKLKDVYKEFIDVVVGGQLQSIADQQRALAETAKQLASATRDLNVTTKDGQKSLVENAKLMAQLESANKRLTATKKASENLEKSAASSVNVLNVKLKEQITAYNQAASATNTDRAALEKMAREINKTRGEIQQMTSAIKTNVNGMNAAKGSYAALDFETRDLVMRLKNLEGGMNSNSAAAKVLKKQIADNTQKLKDFDNGMNQNFRNVGNYKSALAGIGDSIKSYVGMYASLYAGIALVRSIVQSNSEISDSVADLRRTAQLTAGDAENLVSSLKKLDTRTSLKGLLDIAIIGGRLGIARENLLGFTEAADKLTQALGSELGSTEEITTGLGKILNVFQPGKAIDGDALLKLGNAIVDVANKGVASGRYIVDFTQRLSGIAGVAKVSLGAAGGLGAGLEELGTSAEVGGTAVTQILFKIGQDVPKYAKLAGKSTEDFANTLKTAPVEALLQLAEGLAKNKTGFAEISESFKDAEAKGVRVAGTLAVIGTNADFIRGKIGDFSTALTKTNEITDAAALKNETLGASLEKLGNEFTNYTTNGAISNFFKTIVDGARAALKELNALANSRSFGDFYSRITDFTGSRTKAIDARYSIQDNIGSSMSTSSALQTKTRKGFDQFSADELKGLIPQYEKAFKEAARAYNDYAKGINDGLLKDGGKFSLATARQNYDQLKALLSQVSAAYVDARNKAVKANKTTIQTIGSGQKADLTSIQGIRAEIARLSKLPGSADPSSDVASQIENLKSKLKGLSGAAKEPKDALQQLQDQLSKLNSELINGLSDGRIDDADRKVQKSIDATNQKIADLMALRDKLQRGTTVFEGPKGNASDIDKVDFSADNEKERKAGNLLNASDFADQASEISVRYAALNKDLLNQYRDGTLTRERYDELTNRNAIDESNERYFVEKARIAALLLNETEGSKQYIALKEQEANLDQRHGDEQINRAERVEQARLKAIQVVVDFMRNNVQFLADQLGDGFGTIFSQLTNDLENFVKNGKLSFEDFAETAGALASGITDIFKANSEARIEQLEKERDADLESAGDNEAAKAAINKRYDKEIANEKKKQAKADKENAMFQIAINTAIAVVKALPNIPLSIAVGVLGAIQLALVAAKPLPKYKAGRNGGPAELAIVNDGSGPEAIKDRGGKIRIAGGGRETVTWLNEGDKVIPAEQTAKLLTDDAGPDRFVDSLIAGTGVVKDFQNSVNQQLIAAIVQSKMSPETLTTCFRTALNEMEYQQLFVDEKGARTYNKKANQRIFDQNARNTTGGIG